MGLSEYIRKVRKELGFTQDELARQIGSNKFNISNYETGRAIPPGNVLIKIQELDPSKKQVA